MKNKKLKMTKYESEDTKEIRNLIFIVIGIIVVCAGLYFLTAKSLNKKENKESSTEFDYSVCTVGTMFNRPYEEYYVFLYSSEDENALQYQSLVSSYVSKENALKIYTVDLSKNLDNKYLASTSNSNPSNPSEVKIKDSALIHIKNGKVSKYYEKISDYESILK